MTAEKILDLPNDGILNLAADEEFLYVRCMRTLYKYKLDGMSLAASNAIFKKDGRARAMTAGESYIALRDFCDLYVIRKDDLQVEYSLKLGENVSSDLCEVRCGASHVYLSIRGGLFAAVDIVSQSVEKQKLCDGSTWDMAYTGDKLYAGTTGGELLEIDTDGLRLIRRMQLCKPNVHSMVYHKGMLYTASRDRAVRIIDAATFEVVRKTVKAISTSGLLYGVWNDALVVADWGGVSLWDAQTLEKRESFKFPTGDYNGGVLLAGNVLYGSDKTGVYQCTLS